tara:strand:+ start:2340 stop:2516 length:177 start_codon:yes stop_codon:yes gene_type:complete
MNVKLTQGEIEILEFLLDGAKKTLLNDFPNDPDIRKKLLKQYERIEDKFKRGEVNEKH